MLSRTADSVYWMARYTERAENIARLLDVSYRMSMLPRSDGGSYWGAVLGSNGLEEAFRAKYGAIDANNVLRFMAFDEDNPSSIRNALKSARENAHAVRGTLTTETWETLNATWLEMRDMRPSQFTGAEMQRFFEWVKFRSHLSRGVTVGTMLQDEAFHFVRLGTFLERADNTARILDVRYDELAPQPQGGDEYYDWGALLRSVSAFEIYRKVYRDVITPARVAELLILREDMPRSLHACLNAVQEIIGLIGDRRVGETHRRAGALHAALHYGKMDEIFVQGLHDYLTDFLKKTDDLGKRISADFLVPMN
jgi:uncharacterized alpha-E superfamily protein